MSEQRTNSNALEVPMWFDMPHEDRLPEFERLRQLVLEERRMEVLNRYKTRRKPSEEELSAGAYWEQIEPQCREAIFAMRRKGYSTRSSGFGAGNNQVVDGDLKGMGMDTVELLVGKGFSVSTPGGGDIIIAFRPAHADIHEITARWGELAELLPSLDQIAIPHTNDFEEFYQHIWLCEPYLRL